MSAISVSTSRQPSSRRQPDKPTDDKSTTVRARTSSKLGRMTQNDSSSSKYNDLSIIIYLEGQNMDYNIAPLTVSNLMNLWRVKE